MFKQISSLQNPLLKELIQFKEKSRSRKKSNLFLIEGQREITLAISGKYTIEKILFDGSILSAQKIVENFTGLNTEIIEVTNEVYQKLTYRSSTEGVIAVAKSKELTLDSIKFNTTTPLILVAEAPEKPGNIGAILRTADAANVDAVLIANPKTDMYNPNIIRSSVGCLFTTQIATGTSEEIISFLQKKNINIYCAALSDSSKQYQTIDFKSSCAIVVGTENVGLSKEWLNNTTQNIIIPMQGVIDSMNVSVAAGILIFEAKRQRGFT